MPRNVRNVEYLPRFGWTPVVVAPRDAEDLMDIDSLMLIPPGTKVLRTRLFEPRHLRPIVNILRGIARPWRGSQAALGDAASRREDARSPASTMPDGDDDPPLPTPSRFWRLQRLVFFPDRQVGWLPFALVAAIRAQRVGKFDAVYSTSAPVTSHLVAGIFKNLTGVSWVAEFRDPWVGNPYLEPLPWFHRRLRARLERWVVRSADRIVFVSPSTARQYRQRYPGAGEMVTITNGHDPSEVIPFRAVPSVPGRFRIVWAGSLYRPTELRLLLEALQALVARRPSLADELEVVFYGHVSNECRAVADRFTGTGPLRAIVRFQGFVPRRVALEALAGADAALVMLGAGRGMGQFVPGKLFEIVGQNRQVLAVLPPGDARDILKELDWGVIADPDPTDIGCAIERLLTLPPPDRPADPDGRYDRVALARRLAETLEAAAEAPHRPRPARARRPSAGDGA